MPVIIGSDPGETRKKPVEYLQIPEKMALISTILFYTDSLCYSINQACAKIIWIDALAPGKDLMTMVHQTGR